jgi:FkbM family methyltransferase
LKSLAYEVIDLATRRRGIRRTINGESFRFPPAWSRFYPSVYQPETHRFLKEHLRSGVAIDVGAHLGLFAIVMARLAGRVIAFEPGSIRSVLERTVCLNGLQDAIEIRDAAVCERSGMATWKEAASHAGHLTDSGGIPIPTVSLDDLDISPSLLKIDAEGAELDVLRGAERTLATARPLISCDVHPPLLADSLSIWDLLHEADYEISVPPEAFERPTLFEFHAIPR